VNKFLIATAAATVISASASIPANANSSVAFTNDPIKVVRYAAHPAFAAYVPGWGTSYQDAAATGNVTVSFVNAGDVPVTSVQFLIRNGKQTATVTDNGTFSAGIPITHDFAVGPEFDNASAIEVEKVTLADGTSWQRA
jgi:hypothetical protein